MRRILALTAGLFAYFFLEGFIRIVIMFYHRADFQFYGISHLPADVWIVVILFAVLLNSWLVTMLILSVINKNILTNTLIFGTIILLWRLFEILNSYQQEPLWYFVSVIFLNVFGIFLAYQLYSKQHEISVNS
ncbi:MAG: hypothetical protein WD016_08360 [Balneolaceae bacterium]